MIPLKNKAEITLMKKGGQKLGRVMGRVIKSAQPGVTLNYLDRLADSLITKEGGRPSFKMVKDYHWASCLNINQGIVHGIPSDYLLKEGDLLSVDIGIFYRGFNTDMAWTIEIKKGKLKTKNNRFLLVGKKALEEAIKAAKPGNRVGHLSAIIEKTIKQAGFNPIESLTGHGVGKKLHEDPAIPCYLGTKISQTPELKPGMVLAIEVIYSRASSEMKLLPDGWTLVTSDGSTAALYEKTVAVTQNYPLILTPLNLS